MIVEVGWVLAGVDRSFNVDTRGVFEEKVGSPTPLVVEVRPPVS